MAIEQLLADLAALERSIAAEEKALLLSQLRATPTDIDDERAAYFDWKPGGLYFHAIQDVVLVPVIAKAYSADAAWEERAGYIIGSQACFVKDLELYLVLFQGPQKIRSVFESIFRVGTSAPWVQCEELQSGLFPVYQQVDRAILRPWADHGTVPQGL